MVCDQYIGRKTLM